ncbi:MAG TPA: BON domain-containing protein [Thermoanaerobaculia bacterium]|nr:BON domain-containing protein [Thermoanaerobaculia bacterium]
MADNWERDRWDRYGGRGIDRGPARDPERNYDRHFGRGETRDDYFTEDRGSYRHDSRHDSRGSETGAGAGFGGSGFNTLNRDFETRGGYERGSDSASMQPRSYRGRGPKGFQRSDDRLRELVSERLADHHDIDASDIEVTVSNGEVTLQGTVDDRRTKRLAEDVVESVGGVRDVHNHLKVDHDFFNRGNANTTGAAGE